MSLRSIVFLPILLWINEIHAQFDCNLSPGEREFFIWIFKEFVLLDLQKEFLGN
jgi:hypothetical protein